MRISCLFICFFLLAGASFAQTLSVKTKSAPLLDVPSRDVSYPLLQMPHFYPLHVLRAKGDFYRVQDFQGRVGWVEKSKVDDHESVVVDVKTANVRTGPGEDHPVIFRADEGVVFRVLKEEKGWLEVLHVGGQKGWIFKSLTWGW